MQLRLLGALALVAFTGCGTLPVSKAATPAPATVAAKDTEAGTFTSGTHQGFRYRFYLPPNFKRSQPLPMVVMLHGCAQDADTFARVSKMNSIAAKEGFAVLYPEQLDSHHHKRCWRWFDPVHQGRDAGEPGAIHGMVGIVAGQYGIDRTRVYVAGLSAGGAMASVLAANYPETFAAVGSASGLEYLAATDETNAWVAMSLGGPDPTPLARRVYDRMAQKVTMPAMVFHGGSDYFVHFKNGTLTALQWAKVNNHTLKAIGQDAIPEKPSRTDNGQAPGGFKFKHDFYTDAAGKSYVEHVVVTGMAHAWSGGAAGEAYSEPKGPDTARFMWDFFKPHSRQVGRR